MVPLYEKMGGKESVIGITLANVKDLTNEELDIAIEEKNRRTKQNIDTLEVLSQNSNLVSDSVENNTPYLQHAPEKFKELWEKSSPADKEIYKKHVEFTVNGPNIIGASGKKYELAKENLTVADEDVKSGEIRRHEGETYFEWNAMMEYTKKHNISVPTDEMYLDMLKIMPAGDVTEQYEWGAAGIQLFSVLGGKSNGYLSAGKHYYIVNGYLWSASAFGFDAIALKVDIVESTLLHCDRDYQLPVRFLRDSK